MPTRAPRLRPLDAVFVDTEDGRRLVLRDTEGLTDEELSIDASLAPLIALLDGSRSEARIADALARGQGRSVSPAFVRGVVEELEKGLCLEGPRVEARRREVARAFASLASRPAHHAGGAYHADPKRLAAFIDGECLDHAKPSSSREKVVALSAPHMDLWRAARGYGHAYRPLLEGLSDDVDTAVLLGTSHAPMRRPFAVCAKAFETPLGALDPDLDAIDELERASRFDLRADELLHKVEHSVELQAVFVRHVLTRRGHRPVRVIPILCGLGEAQSRLVSPDTLTDAESFLAALARLVDARRDRVVVISGADLAHVGPRFGDAAPLAAKGRASLERRDRASLDLVLGDDAEASRAFFDHVTSDAGSRRVCGVGPMYTMMRAIEGAGARGEVVHYAQHVDPGDGSIVSHASVVYRG